MKNLVKLALTLVLVASPARAQDAEGLRTSLTEMLSVLTLGSVSVPAQSADITQSGADFRVQIPLTGFAAPPTATAEATAHPDVGGIWTVTSLAFPSSGALGRSIDQATSYTIGQQTIAGRLDPNLATASTLNADLGAITLQSMAGGRNTEQTIERVTLNGSLSAAPNNRLDLSARNSATNWHAIAHDPPSEGRVRQVDGHVTLSGLDHAQGIRLMTAARSLMQAPASQPDLSPQARDALRGMLDAAPGLLTRIEADETAEGLRFDLGQGTAGTLGHLQMRLKGTAEDQRLNGALDVEMDEASFASLSPDTAAFLPHHLTARSILAGVPVAPLLALLRTAITPHPDEAAVQQQATALLNAPGARAAIESIAFDAGAAHVRGSVNLLTRATGEAGADIHISATGVDALLSQVQGNPSLRGMMPFIFIAKGIGRAKGDAVVWDISVGGGPLTVNGMPFGQAPGRTR